LSNEDALGSVCALRGLVAFWQGQCRQGEAKLHTSAEAEASAKRVAAADMAALASEAANSKHRLQSAQQKERQLQQQLALLEVRRAFLSHITDGLKSECSPCVGNQVSMLHHTMADAGCGVSWHLW
jgi:chromosome segregation ATPase